MSLQDTSSAGTFVNHSTGTDLSDGTMVQHSTGGGTMVQHSTGGSMVQHNTGRVGRRISFNH